MSLKRGNPSVASWEMGTVMCDPRGHLQYDASRELTRAVAVWQPCGLAERLAMERLFLSHQ